MPAKQKYSPSIESLEDRFVPAGFTAAQLLEPPTIGAPTQTVFNPLPDSILADDFGYDRLNAEGERPLIVLLVNVPPQLRDAGAGDFEKGTSYYRDLLFNPGQQNVRDYYLENSKGVFTWKETLVIPIDYPASQISSFSTNHPSFDDARWILSQRNDIDWSAYDTNNNRVIETHELGVLVIDNVTTTLAATRQTARPVYAGTGYLPPSVFGSYRLAFDVAAAGYQASFASITHELSHLLGTVDLYGVNDNNFYQSLMGPTIIPELYLMDTFHLDPWHKIQLGWEKPLVYPLLPSVNSVELQPGTGPILIFNPTRGYQEYYLMEYRDSSALAYDKNVDFAGESQESAGVGLWYVNVQSNHDLAQIPRFIVTGNDGVLDTLATVGDDEFEYMLDANGNQIPIRITAGDDMILQTQRNANDLVASDAANLMSINPIQVPTDRLRTAADGLISPVWLDGTDTALRIRIGPPTDSKITVEWGVGTEFVPQIQSVANRTKQVGVGQDIVLHGVFGIRQQDLPETFNFRESQIVSLTDGVRDYDAQVVSWTHNRIEIRITEEMPAGPCKLVIYTDGTRTVKSNTVDFIFAPTAVLSVNSSTNKYQLAIRGTDSFDALRLTMDAAGNLSVKNDDLGGWSMPLHILAEPWLTLPMVPAATVESINILGYDGSDAYTLVGDQLFKTFQGRINVQSYYGGTPDIDSLTIDVRDAADAQNTYTLGQHLFFKNGETNLGRLDFGDVSALYVKTSANQDTVSVEHIFGEVAIDTGAGNDNVILMPTEKNLELLGHLTLLGGTGRDRVTAYDSNNPYTLGAGHDYFVASGTLGRDGKSSSGRPLGIRIDYSAMEEITLYAGAQADNIDVLRSGVTINAGLRADRIRVSPQAKNLVSTASVTINGDGGSDDQIFLFDQNNTDPLLGTPEIYTITNANVARQATLSGVTTPLPIKIAYTGVEGMTLHSAQGQNIFNVTGTPGNTVIDSAPGINQFAVGSAQRGLDLIRGKLSIEGDFGTNSLVINDVAGANTSGRWYEMLGTSAEFGLNLNFARKITGHGITGVDLSTSSGPDLLTVTNTAVPTSIKTGAGQDVITITAIGAATSINSGAGIDTFNLGATTAPLLLATLNLDGSSEADLLRGPLGVSAQFDITAANAGTVTWQGLSIPVRFTSTESLAGGNANDRFVVQPGASVSGSLDGSNGTDALDYSNWKTSLLIDANTRTSPGGAFTNLERIIGGSADDLIRGDQRPGYFNILEGGDGNDILIGGQANDTLLGGTGRDLLIGGFGSDLLDGGQGEDILISDVATFAANNTTLNSIRTSWLAPTPYNVRIAGLRTTINSSTIKNDSAQDTLTGDPLSLDWFWANAGDILTDRDLTKETLN